MSDNLQERGPQDRSRISLTEEHEVRYWTQKLGVTKEALAEAVRAVGASAGRVEQHLRGGRRRRDTEGQRGCRCPCATRPASPDWPDAGRIATAARCGYRIPSQNTSVVS